ncbi:MAG: BON domain-containing protein [Betaproteobacteria bacterium]|nr:BON domain-containing protein [Betaproteobacteria bacterium]
MKTTSVILAALLVALPLAGCVEMAVVGVGAAALSLEDRRTTGAQVEDEGLELRAANRIGERYGSKVHVNVTSFNRFVLLTGEAPDQATKAAIEKLVLELPSKPRGVSNELRVTGSSSLTARSNDTLITGKVKARFLDAKKFNPLHVKVVTEAATVYLMGIVTQAEADAAVEVTRTTGGVVKVIKVFEYCQATDQVCRPRGAAKPKAGS